jgi:hypothetical protein
MQNDSKPKLPSYGLAIITFLAGIGGTLLTQSFVGEQQLAHAKRETRVATMRDYASACFHDSVSISNLATLPLQLAALERNPVLSDKDRMQKAIALYDEALNRAHESATDLAVKTEIVNALFETKVDPVAVELKDLPPEFDMIPGQVDANKLIESIQGDPIATLKKGAVLLGKESVALSGYCRDSIQALSKEID